MNREMWDKKQIAEYISLAETASGIDLEALRRIEAGTMGETRPILDESRQLNEPGVPWIGLCIRSLIDAVNIGAIIGSGSSRWQAIDNAKMYWSLALRFGRIARE